jgi:hypothetical protein
MRARRREEDVMERGSDKHGPVRDESMKHEVEGEVRSGRRTHVEEWRQAEPVAEDQLDLEGAHREPRSGGTPPGMTPEDVEIRSELARYLGRAAYPADRDELVRVMAEHHAPDRLIEAVSTLPEGVAFANVAEVAEGLGIHPESHRF